MAKYDSLGVPILGFHNPAGLILYPEGLFSYSMGNTRARDLTELLGTSKERQLDLLLLASGDVRNIFYTVSEVSLRKPEERANSLNFHLNDYDPTIVARNAILLEVAGSINPDISEDLNFLWNIWYNMTLSKAHFVRIQKILSAFVERKFDDLDWEVLNFNDTFVLKECREIWKDWCGLDLDVKSVKKERNEHIGERMQRMGFKVDDQCFGVLSQMMMTIASANEDKDILLPKPGNSFYAEIKHWFEEGSTGGDSEKTNPTLIRPFVHKWKQHYGACAFESYLPFEKKDLLRCGSLTAACKEKLKLLVKRYQQYQKSKPAALKVTLWTGDALALCTSGFPAELTFDVIDTTNVSDHIGLLNVLVCCAPRLKTPNQSLLFTSSMLWEGGCQNIEDFYNQCVGVPVGLLPTVLGLKLAVDFDLGSSKLPDKVQSSEEILCWVKAEPERTVLTIDNDNDVSQALLRLAERCFNLQNVRDSQVYGVTLSSPLTFMRIIHQIQPLISGGATAVFNLLESELPADFHEKFGLSWNLLKASVGSEQESILEIQVTTKLSVVSWYKGTPIPIICITDNGNLEMGQFQMLFGLPFNAEPNFSMIYNSLRYDDTNNVMTFHLRERDWNEIKSRSWMWVSTRDPIEVLECVEMIFLEGEEIKTIERVDPVEKFGLFSGQTFIKPDSTPNNRSQVVKVLKVVESQFSYSAELEVMDSNRCKAKDMKISFEPDRYPTKVTINFERDDGSKCALHFSCPVDKNSSKFQISRGQGKVLCHIPKKEEGTVGELVIQNPAPVPFHALPLWDANLQDSATVFDRVFRTKNDMELKVKRQSGPPFFDLRETIAMILSGHIRDSKVPKIYCIDERGVIEEPYQTSENIARKKGFIVKVQELYKWKNVPVAKVLFYDCQKFAQKFGTGTADTKTMESFFSVTWLHVVERVVADQQEKALLRKLLYKNATRVAQSSDSGVWRGSFLSLLFPRESAISFFKSLKDMTPNMFSTAEAGSTAEPAFSPDVYFNFVSNLFQQERGSFLSGTDPMFPFRPHNWAPPLKEPDCAFCHSNTGDLKRCLGCNKVFYCSKVCQKRHWKQHKSECQNDS